MKPQIKTQKVLDLISKMKSNLKEDNDISLHYYTQDEKNMLCLTYSTCIRRDYPYQVAKRYKNDIQKFIDICNQSSLFKKKINDFRIDLYKDEEYDEYEIEVGRSIQIKLGKNQTRFFK